MNKNTLALLFTLLVITQPTLAATHPCTGDELPFSTEDQLIRVIECELSGKVVKLTEVPEPPDHFKARVLLEDGRVKTVLIKRDTGVIANHSQ